MNGRESGEDLARRERAQAASASAPHYGRYVGLLAVLIVVALTIGVALTRSNGATGIAPGQSIPPFAAPLASGTVTGDVNVATRANQGAAGNTPACAVRGAGVLNMCELYERGPVVLALFVDAGSCPAVLADLEALAREFPGVSFAAVAIKGERGSLRRLIRERGLTSVAVGFDSDGVLASMYRLASCPQVTLVLPGGAVQSAAMLSTPPLATLRTRVGELVTAAKARGWKAPA